jgi:hypothetical protein
MGFIYNVWSRSLQLEYECIVTDHRGNMPYNGLNWCMEYSVLRGWIFRGK